jgi:hypothetical protein
MGLTMATNKLTFGAPPAYGDVEMNGTKQRADVKMIEAALTLLERERNKLLDRQAQHGDKKCALAFDEHAGDAEASNLLDQLQREAVEIQTQIDGISDAITEGQHRLVLARAREQQELNAIKAEALPKVLGRFTQAGRELEQAVTALVLHRARCGAR